jgi:signal transduction histidine kinase
MDQTIREIRGTIFVLQAREAEVQWDPRADIVSLVEEMTEMLGFAPSLRLGPGLRGLDSEDQAGQALIVLREALSNVARHAAATRADVTVDVDANGFLSVTVTDDGTGIPSGSRRSGLRNRRARRGARRRVAG